MATQTQTKSTGKTLEIEIWYRQGSAYSDEYQCEVIYGDAETEVEYDKYICELNFPYRCPGVMKVVPYSVPVIILCHGSDNTGDVEAHVIDMYVFTQEGWKYIKVKE